MSLDLNLPDEKIEQLTESLKSDSNYLEIQSKMRAAVILCAQELMNNESEESSGFNQFKRSLPDEEAITSIAVAMKYLESIELNNCVSVLKEELNSEELEKVESLISDENNKLQNIF